MPRRMTTPAVVAAVVATTLTRCTAPQPAWGDGRTGPSLSPTGRARSHARGLLDLRPRGHGPGVHHPALPRADETLRQVDGRTDVGGDHLDEVPHPEAPRVVGELDPAVLLPEPVDLAVGILADHAVAVAAAAVRSPLRRERFAPGIQHRDIAGRTADHPSEDRQRAFVGAGGPPADLHRVVDDIGAWANLRDPRDPSGAASCWGRTDADLFDLDPRAPQPVRLRHHDLAFFAAGRLEIRPVASVGEDAGDPESLHPGQRLGQRHQVLAGADPAPPKAAVHLDEDIQRHPGGLRRARQRLRSLRGVHPHPNANLSGQRDQPGELGGADHFVGEEDIAHARLGHHLRLADLGQREADGARLDLPPGDLDALVRLPVGPELDPGIPRERRPPGDVGVEAVEVHDQDRGIERADRLRGRRPRLRFEHSRHQRPPPTAVMESLRSTDAIRSGRSGMSRCRTPRWLRASTTALTTAGVEPIVAASPIPLAPSGLRGVGVTEVPRSMRGRKWAEGMPYSASVPVTSCPWSSYVTASSRAW